MTDTSRWFADYFWFIAKNILGWILILVAWPVGLLVPGPGGIPLFLIGFALITFPGKRSFTARILHGTPVDLHLRRYRWVALISAAALPAIAFWISSIKRYPWTGYLSDHRRILLASYAFAFVICWIITRVLLRLLNIGLRSVPSIRRRVRPWLRKQGIDLLPPRRRKRLGHYPGSPATPQADEEILEIHERHQRRFRDLWLALKPYAKRGVGILFAILVFAWLIHRITQHWSEIRQQVGQFSILQAFGASILFALFLVIFRMMTWWRIVAGLGHPLPFRPALRIWTTSELARYVGSGVSQLLGRVYLSKPYGVDAGVASASQILELVLFLLANILVAVCCMIWLGVKIDGMALGWFYVACALIPLLLGILHPKIFYGLFNRILRKLRKPEVHKQLPASTLVGLLLWNVLGLFFQGWAIWLLTHQPLGLKPQHWWVVTGAYCLAWMAGFIAVWAQAGLGVREPVFVLAAWVALPFTVRQTLKNPKVLLDFLSILLRLWATVGELMLAVAAYFLDYRGAIGSPLAPGRLPAADADPPPDADKPS